MNLGCQPMTVADGAGVNIPVIVIYPTRGAEAPARFGPYSVDVVTGGPVEGDDLPLVVVSHGTGGSPFTNRGLAAFLARAGFVVALIDHPGNSRSDDSLANTAANLERRPRHLVRVIDALFADPRFGSHLRADAVGAVGNSMGGYTILAAAGAKPTAFAHETPDGSTPAVPVTPDPRIKALVLLTPATAWYMAPGALAEVTAPILMLTAGQDQFTPAWHGDLLAKGVADPAKVEHYRIDNAGHFSFLSPFPPEMVTPGFIPAQDPPGFDRAAFQPQLAGMVERFFRATL